MSKNRLITLLSILFFVLAACTLPYETIAHLEPYADIIEGLLGYPPFPAKGEEVQNQDADPQDKSIITPATATIEATLSPPQVPTQMIQKPATPTKVELPWGKIIYTCQADKNPSHDQICIINPDGSGFRQLTSDMTFQHFYPSWAPDGKSFVFSGAQTGEFKIYEMDLNGSMNIVGDISGELYAPAISPDGKKIVFTRHFSESEQYISVCDRDGSDLKNLTAYYDAKDPVWSPDGSKILFTSMQNGTPQLYFMNSDGTTIQKVSELAGLRGRTDWAVDLAIATYAGEREERNREIVILELGEKPVVITEGGDNLSPSFSPDGQWIVFMSYRSTFWEADGCELYIMRRDGSDVKQLTSNEYCDYQPRWGP